jgi:hypothetical protein
MPVKTCLFFQPYQQTDTASTRASPIGAGELPGAMLEQSCGAATVALLWRGRRVRPACATIGSGRLRATALAETAIPGRNCT